MTPAEFRAALEALGLRQVDLMHILAYLRDDASDRVTVSRWATGRRDVPANIVAILRLLEMLSKSRRDRLLKDAR